MSDLLADAEAELYQADPDQFTARRADLAARARDAGEPAAAKRITALRKPTRSAWVVNRLVRADPEVRGRLDALAADLRGAAGGSRLRELTAARSRLVDELTRAALRAADLKAPQAALREEVTATLDAAIADPEVAARLGTLVRAERWAGFGQVPDGAGPRPPGRERPEPVKVPERADAAAERAARREEKIADAERALTRAEEDLRAADEAERSLADTVGRLEAELARARERLAEARRQSYRAESRQQKAARQLGRLRG